MSPPEAELHTLPSTFNHADWTIKYALISPPSSQNTSPTKENSSYKAETTKTLLFIHGTPWSSTVFQPLVHALQASNSTHRILLYDLPGYGQSQHLVPSTSTPSPRGFPGDTSVAAQALALTALLSHLEISNPAVLAHDIAGAIALRAHLLHGVDFERLMLLDTNVVLPWGDGFYSLARENPEVFARLPSHVFEAMLRAVVRSASVVPHGLAGGWEEALVAPWLEGGAAAQRSFVKQIAQAEDGDVAEMFAEGGQGCVYGTVRCGVTVLWGDGDSWIPRKKMEMLCKLLGTKLEKFVVLEEAGHLVMLDQPGRVEEEVREWLEVASGRE